MSLYFGTASRKIVKLLFTLILTMLAASTTLAASSAYEPLFPLDPAMSANPRGTVLGDYAHAQRSEDSDVAITRWEQFLDDYAYRDPVAIDDLTQLNFVRLAHYELLRLYYILDKTDQADALLRKTENLTVYSSPPIGDTTRWCKVNGYCR